MSDKEINAIRYNYTAREVNNNDKTNSEKEFAIVSNE